MLPTQSKQDNRGMYLQFTIEVWKPLAREEGPTSNMEEDDDINLQSIDMFDGKTKTVQSEEFLFLDIAMMCKNISLCFGVYHKPNQALEYVDTSSTYRPTAFKSITNRVFTRLT
eukprot:4796781-Ditylum_brightwellii.AAC.1